MDDRKPPESNVVRLRRDDEPDEDERRRLARTIFASEDDVGTFSRGNLLLPPKTPPHEEPPAEPDPFFEQLQGPDHSGPPGSVLGDPTDTVAYFEKLGSQTAAEMSAEETAAQPTAVSMPGSARLPAEINKPRRRAARRNRAATSDGPAAKPTVSRRRSPLAVAPVAASLGVLLVAGAALAAIVAGNGHSGAPHRPLATHQSTSGSAATAFLPSSTGASKERTRTSRRDVVGQHRSEGQRHRRVGARKGVKHATRGATTPARSAPAASTVPVSATQAVANPALQEPASAASSSTSGSSGSGGASSSHQPVWGANGILGPGHSPNG